MAILGTPKQPEIPKIYHDCEICGEKNIDQEHAFSVIISYATPGYAKQSYQCDAQQHWCCSHACAMKAAHACLDEHIHMQTEKHGVHHTDVAH